MKSSFKTQNRAIGKGLYFLFIAEALGLLSLVPMMGTVMTVASALVSIYALYMLNKADGKYRVPFILTILNVVLAILYSYSVLAGLHDNICIVLLSTMYILKAVMVFFICTTTAKLPRGLDPALAEQASWVWKVVLFSDLLAAARALLVNAPETIYTTDMMNSLAPLISVAATVIYLVFLWKSQKILQKD